MIDAIVRWLAIASLAITPALACADGGKRPIVGEVLLTTPANAAPWDKAFRDGLRELLGYVEGENVDIAVRYAQGDASRLPEIFRELIGLPVDVMLVADMALPAARKATKTVPIVSPSMGSPVELGLVNSLAHPGGNLTGLTVQNLDSDPKRLELITELVPRISRLGLLFENYPTVASDLRAFQELAQKVGITTVQLYQAGNLQEIETALKAISNGRLQALVVWNSAVLGLYRERILQATAHRLPTLVDGREFAQSGALISYAPNTFDLFRRSAGYVDKILKGSKPGDLPIAQPTKFELIVNLKTAKLLRLRIPDSILLRADEIIR